MAKTPSDKLHRLICALTPAEKRYFRIFIRGKTERDSKYFLLFEVLEAAIIYDSPAVQQAVYGGEKVTTKKYTELKAYLYDLILKALESFDEQQSVESRVQHLLKGVATLFKRGHYDDCEELLHKAQKITEKYELFNPQLDIFKWRRQLAYTRMDVHFLHHHLDLLDFEEAQILRKLNNLMAYRKTFFSIYSFIKKDAFQRDGNRMAALKIMLPESLFDSSEMALSIRAHILYLRTINLYYYAIQDMPWFYDPGKNLVELIENQPFFI